MKHVGPTRVELGTRTIFKPVGTAVESCAGVRRQMVGLFRQGLDHAPGRGAGGPGFRAAWVVHGSDGLDEITISGTTDIASLENGRVRTFEISPEDVGLTRAPAEACAAAMRAQCHGPSARSSTGPLARYRDVALMNAGAALLISGRAKDLTEGVDMARASIDSGAARARLEHLASVSQALAPRWTHERHSHPHRDLQARAEIAAAKAARPLSEVKRRAGRCPWASVRRSLWRPPSRRDAPRSLPRTRRRALSKA